MNTSSTNQYTQSLLYIICGVGATIINIAVYWLAVHTLGLGVLTSTCIAWVMAVLFAFFSNKLFVFKEKSMERNVVAKQGFMFFACRLGSGLLDLACMYIGVSVLAINDMYVKLMANIVVIIVNYVASNFYIFRKKP